MSESHSWSRRAFLNTSVALAFAPWMTLAAGTLGMPPVHAVVIDRRFAELAATLNWSAGATVIPYVGDMTRVWFDHVEPLWRARPTAALAGVTSEQSLFCFEQLCWDHRLRVITRQHVTHWRAPGTESHESVYAWLIARPGSEWTGVRI